MYVQMEQRLIRLLLHDEIDLLFVKELFDELENTAKRHKFHRYYDASRVDELILVLVEVVVPVDVRSKVDVCRDPKDNFLLALAQDGIADYLITGDKDLLSMKKWGTTKIVLLTDFEKILND
jgi:putative PIN family toxin of toxin-antitoxin system